MAETTPVTEEEKKATILVVEDNPLISEMYVYKLKLEGYETYLATDGIEAVKFIFEWTIIPELIILDIMMPNMNGFEALEKIRSDSRFDETKIIIFSNLSERKDRERCFALGADDFLLKATVTPKDLIEHVGNLLKQYD